MPEASSFLMITCQVGAERAVKGELARRWPQFRFAYSRPGFLTFKLPADHKLADDFNLESVFARSYAFSLGKAAGGRLEERAQQVRQLAGDREYRRLHVFERDRLAPGDHGYEPGLTEAAAEADAAIRAAWPAEAPPAETPLDARPLAKAGELVLDCVLVQPDEWWIGYHRARSWASRRPGGLSRLKLPENAVSRAYLKMEETLRWSHLPIRPGDRAAEIGCAPGGSCQALLRRGLLVAGIDPAAVDPAVLADPHFLHIRKRGADVRRRDFRSVRWLLADMNVAPAYTLDTLEAIVTHKQVRIRGLLVTLKLLDWKLADDVPAYLQRIKSWGFPYLRARQLQHNRQEICVAAMRCKPKPPLNWTRDAARGAERGEPEA
ncbi:MAG TPA: SAM-dependent methyltransferase [Pirellulales bacterium]|nr:SAM-dependent methyltransferase [Pirellulales bacterium]